MKIVFNIIQRNEINLTSSTKLFEKRVETVIHFLFSWTHLLPFVMSKENIRKKCKDY